MMKRTTILLAMLASLILIAQTAQAQRVRPAQVYRPNHVMANHDRTCPPGYSRLFGANPPTCFQNCPVGWSLYSSHISGAKCVQCPTGYVIRTGPAPDVYNCVRVYTPGGGDGTPGGGTFGQP